MSDQLFIGVNDFRDQRERMVEEYDIPEEEAEEAFTNAKTQVMLASQEAEQDWSDETINAVTNLIIAIQQQQYQNAMRRKSDFYSRLFVLLGGSLIAAGTGLTAGLIHAGSIPFAFASAAFTATLILLLSRYA